MKTEVRPPKVSVCVVTYNQEKYIRQCLQSIIDQDTNFDFEIIVGEDCSTDGTRKILQELQLQHPTLIKLILHPKNIGIFENFRTVHYAAQGEYISHLDGDDYWHQNKLQSQFDFIERNAICAAVYTNAWIRSTSGKILGIFSSGVKEIFDLSYLIKDGNFLTNSSILYRKQYREYAIPASGEFVDYMVHIRLARCGLLGFIDKTFVSYIHNSDTSTITNHGKKVRLLIWDALNTVDESDVETRIIKNAKVNLISSYIAFELTHGQLKHARFWASIMHSQSIIENAKINIMLFTSIIHQILKKIILRNNKVKIIYKK